MCPDPRLPQPVSHHLKSLPIQLVPLLPHPPSTGGSFPLSTQGCWVRADTGHGALAGEQSPLACIKGRARLPALGTSSHPGEVPSFSSAWRNPTSFEIQCGFRAAFPAVAVPLLSL